MKFLNKYSSIKESNQFNYNKLILEIRHTTGWKELSNPSDTYPNTIFASEYLIERGYKILLLIKKNDAIINAPFYLKNEIKDELIWLDSLVTPIRNRRYQMSNSDWMIDIAKRQMEYYYQLDKMPDEVELRDMLTDITDLGFEIDLITFGYVNNSFPTDYWDRDIGASIFGSSIKFVYVIYLSAVEESARIDIRDRKINKSRTEINNFMKRVKTAFSLRTTQALYFPATGDSPSYTSDDGVIIILT